MSPTAAPRAPTPPEVAPAPPAPVERGGAGGSRLVSLDAFRGLTIAAMILVNNPGSWGAIYPPLRHAAWHGWTPTDLVFPFFLFVVGVAIPFALGRRVERGDPRGALVAKAAKRAAVLFALGAAMAAYPFVGTDWGTLRVPGVLQRIAVCYLAASLLYLYARPRTWAALGVGVLVAYWPLLALVPVPGVGPAALAPPEATLAAWLDRVLLGPHLWSQADRLWDPEGVLSTFPAVVTTLLGVATGVLLRRDDVDDRVKAARMVGWGAALAAAGLLWGTVFPVNKQLWTSSYVLLSGGLALLGFAACYGWADVRGRRDWARPWVIYGVNALTVFVASGLLAKTMGRVRVGDTTLHGWIYGNVFSALPGPPEVASLAHALAWVAAWWLVLAWMWRRGIVLKA